MNLEMETERNYHGSCHCGKIQFEITADIDHVRVCDCSICRRRGALIFRIPRNKLSLLTDWEALSIYRWGSMTAKDYFCPTCGILVFREPSKIPEQGENNNKEDFNGWAVNVRCLDEIELSAVPQKKVFGSRLEF